jgi:hypothetical protein
MAEYPLNRTVFKKEAYENAIDTSFAQSSTPPPPLEDTISITEFFDLYDAIFYDIPVEGDINSHTYIALTSGEYANVGKDNEDVQALLDEITDLRQQNLELSQQLAGIQTTSSFISPITTNDI